MKTKVYSRTVRMFRHRVHVLDCHSRPVFRVSIPFLGVYLVPEHVICGLGGWNAASKLILSKHTKASLETLFQA